jgi:hypothetical protein
VVFAAGSRLLVAGGLLDGDVSTAQVLTVDPSSGAVRRTGSLASAVHDAAGAEVAGERLVIGGGAATTIGTVQSLGSGGGPARVVGALPTPRSDLTAAVGGKVGYVVGGYDGTGLPAAVLATTDGQHFHSVATLPVPVRYAATAIAGGALWVVGGRSDAAGNSVTAAVQRVDLATGRASVVARLPHPLSDAVAVTVDGAVLVCGGDRDGTTATAEVLRLDTSTGHVRSAGRLAYPVADAGATVLGPAGSQVAYLLGGEAAVRTARVQSLRLG